MLKETSLNLSGRVLPRAMVRAQPYHAVHLEYLPIINLGRDVPSLVSSRAITCLCRHKGVSNIACLTVIWCEQWSVQGGTCTVRTQRIYEASRVIPLFLM
jgi:hypothetical protein